MDLLQNLIRSGSSFIISCKHLTHRLSRSGWWVLTLKVGLHLGTWPPNCNKGKISYSKKFLSPTYRTTNIWRTNSNRLRYCGLNYHTKINVYPTRYNYWPGFVLLLWQRGRHWRRIGTLVVLFVLVGPDVIITVYNLIICVHLCVHT